MVRWSRAPCAGNNLSSCGTVTDSEELSEGRRAYRLAADTATSDHPLPGEDPRSADPDDARHWISVYEELLQFKHDVIETIHGHVQEMSPEAGEEVGSTDLVIMLAERARFARRIAYWRARLAEVAPPPS